MTVLKLIVFVLCLQGYLKHFAYSNTVGNDLWHHLQMVRFWYFSVLFLQIRVKSVNIKYLSFIHFGDTYWW